LSSPLSAYNTIFSKLLPEPDANSLYTDYHDAYCVKRAEQLKVAVNINEPKDFESKAGNSDGWMFKILPS
jgi:folate-dependent phosphoribosylglycinamide formyltransferase PurN